MVMSNNKLKILFIPSWYPSKQNPAGGVFFEHQVEALKKKDANVGIILPPIIENYLNKKNIINIFHIFKKPVIKIDNYNGNDVYTITINGITRIFWLQLFFLKYATNKLYKKYYSDNGKPDIIHAHSAILGGIVAFYIKKKYNIPYVLTELITHYAENKVPSKMLFFLRKVFRYANSKIMISPQLGKVLENKIGESVLPWEWVPNIAADHFFNTVSFEEKKK
jgi:hypothetical protein